jgi:CheY-like chemotaxis protein
MERINRILLIDDDNIFNYLNKKIIEISQLTANVTSHVNAKKALNELKLICDSGADSFPDIIFLDINMPVMDGWEFLDEFEKFPESIVEKCRVYILTSSIDPNDIEKSKAYKSVKDFISKPLSEEILKSLFIPSPLNMEAVNY